MEEYINTILTVGYNRIKVIDLEKNLLLYVYMMCMCAFAGMYMTEIRRSEDNLVELVLYFHLYVYSRN